MFTILPMKIKSMTGTHENMEMLTFHRVLAMLEIPMKTVSWELISKPHENGMILHFDLTLHGIYTMKHIIFMDNL